jgi:hypothetical protein
MPYAEVEQNLGISLADVYPLLSSPFFLLRSNRNRERGIEQCTLAEE